MSRTPQPGRRFVIETSSAKASPRRRYQQPQRTGEIWFAISIIGAATLATFMALFLTSRPNDPMSSTLAPQQTIPQASVVMPSPKLSPTPSPESTRSPTSSPEASGETAHPAPDDATIQTQIESALAGDSTLAKLDVSTIVEGGRVTIVGSVTSVELKQRIAKAIRSVKGVVAVDNQLIVIEPTP
jgi:hypothetical protein